MSFDRKAHNKAYQEANREKIKARKKVHYEANREGLLAKGKAYRNREEILARSKAYREANREKVNASRNAWRKDRYYSDPLFKLTEVYRSAISRGFRSVCLKKDIKSIDCLGCSWEEFQDHIQSQFYDRAETGEKMTFENHGYYGWHLDHIIPISSAKTEEKSLSQ